MLTAVTYEHPYCTPHAITRLRERFIECADRSDRLCIDYIAWRAKRSITVVEFREKHHIYYGRTAKYYHNKITGLEIFFIISDDNTVITVLTKFQFLCTMRDAISLKAYHDLLWTVANS